MRRAEYTKGQLALIGRLESDLTDRMSAVKPRRLAHSLSVARCAESLALRYDKVVSDDELVRRARELGIDFGVDLDLVRPLLHGVVAARELPGLYPELAPEVFQAIARHTTAAVDMTPLDEVVFVADGIEPLRTGSVGIQQTRDMVGRASLDDVFWNSFCAGIEYVVETRRYLYPGTLDIYNELALRRAGAGSNAPAGR